MEGTSSNPPTSFRDEDLSIPEGMPVEWPSTSGHSTSQSKRIVSSPTYMLLSSPKSSCIDIDLLRIQIAYDILDDFEMCLASPFERLDWLAEGYTCFYEIVFQKGFVFPSLN